MLETNELCFRYNTAFSNYFLDVIKAFWKEKLTKSDMVSMSTAYVTHFSFSPPLLISISLPSCIYVEKVRVSLFPERGTFL